MAELTVMRGRVVRLTERGPLVEVPDLGIDYAFGPCPVATNLTVKVNDRVFVASVGGVVEDVMIIGLVDPPKASYRTVVNYDTVLNAYPPRPADALFVEWVGPVEPTAGIENDTWVNTG